MISRRPSTSTISTLAPRRSRGSGAATPASGTTIAGTNPPGTSLAIKRRQVNNSVRDIPWRRAVSDTRRGPLMLSSTIRRFSSSVQRRRRPVSTISSRPKALCVWLSIPTVLNDLPQLPQGGLRRMRTHPVSRELDDLYRETDLRVFRPSFGGHSRDRAGPLDQRTAERDCCRRLMGRCQEGACWPSGKSRKSPPLMHGGRQGSAAQGSRRQRRPVSSSTPYNITDASELSARLPEWPGSARSPAAGSAEL